MSPEIGFVARRSRRTVRITCCAVLVLSGPGMPASGAPSRAEAPFGLADHHHCQRFAEDFVRVLHRRWSNLPTPRARGQALVDEVNDRLQGVHVPKVGFKVSKADAPLGFFNPENWTVHLARKSLASPWLDDRAAAELADTVYHEGRHAEQWLLALRWHFDAGLGSAPLSTARILLRVKERARKKKRLQRGSAEARLGARWHKTLFGEDRAMHGAILETLATTRQRWEALQGAGSTAERDRAWQRYQAAWSLYVALPDEADAIAVGQAVQVAAWTVLSRQRR